MLSNEVHKGKNREQKWKIFFDEEPVGQQIKASISKQNPAWTKDQAAAEISGIYRFICLGVYSSPNDMHNNKTNRVTEVGQLKEKAKIISVLSCIASAIESMTLSGMLPLPEA